MLVIELLGWAGAALLLLAYFFLVHHDLDRSSWMYHAMNLLGTSFLGINSYVNGAMPSAGISVVWALIACYGFYFVYQHKK